MDYSKNRKQFYLGLITGMIGVLVLGSGAYFLSGVVRAVTFDSDIVPVTGSSIRVGVSSGQIQSINNTLFFSGQSVGIGTATVSTSTIRLQLEGGGLRFNNLGSQPPCTSNLRGLMWFTPGSGGTGDTLAVCYWTPSTGYAWATFQGK